MHGRSAGHAARLNGGTGKMLFHEWLLRQERLLRETGKCDVPGVTQSVVYGIRGFSSTTGPTAALTAQTRPLNQEE